MLGDVGVHPEIEANAVIKKLLRESGGIGETLFLPLEGAGVGFGLPTWFETNDIKGHIVVFKICDFLFRFSGTELSWGAVPETKSPEWRHGTTTRVEIIASDNVLKVCAGETDELNAISLNVCLHRITGWDCEPRAGLLFVSRGVAVDFFGQI